MGQEVVFLYTAAHDVYRLPSRAAYDACAISQGVRLGYANNGGGTASLPNRFAYPVDGLSWFACGVPGHCAAGQKLQVVTAPTQSP